MAADIPVTALKLLFDRHRLILAADQLPMHAGEPDGRRLRPTD